MWCTYKPDFSHIDPAHAFGSVRLPDNETSTFTHTARFICRYCELAFANADARFSHEQLVHTPKPQPMMLVHGIPVGRSRFKSFSALSRKDIRFYHWQRVVLNGCPVGVDELYDLLSAPGNDVYRIELQGETSNQVFELEFEIMQPLDIQGVEQAFQRLCERGSDDILLESFRREALQYKTASSYFAALYDYLQGIKIKEGRGLTFESHKFTDKFERADVIFRRINRPLASTIHAIIKFNMNNFVQVADLAIPSGILNCLQFFTGSELIIKEYLVEKSQLEVPVDKATHWILTTLTQQFFKMDFKTLQLLKTDIADLLQHTTDKDKFDYFLYRKAIIENNFGEATVLKKRLTFDGNFTSILIEGEN